MTTSRGTNLDSVAKWFCSYRSIAVLRGASDALHPGFNRHLAHSSPGCDVTDQNEANPYVLWKTWTSDVSYGTFSVAL